MDVADQAADVIERSENDAINRARKAVAAIPAGTKGKCRECRDLSPRLVERLCAPCRDNFNRLHSREHHK